MRAYRLYLIYSSHLEHFELKKKHGVFGFKKARSLHFVREKNMLKWLFLIMIPLIIATIVAVSYVFLTLKDSGTLLQDFVPLLRSEDLLLGVRLLHRGARGRRAALPASPIPHY